MKETINRWTRGGKGGGEEMLAEDEVIYGQVTSVSLDQSCLGPWTRCSWRKHLKFFYFGGGGGVLTCYCLGRSESCTLHDSPHRPPPITVHTSSKWSHWRQSWKPRWPAPVWSCCPLLFGLQYWIQVSSCKLQHMKIHCNSKRDVWTVLNNYQRPFLSGGTQRCSVTWACLRTNKRALLQTMESQTSNSKRIFLFWLPEF